MFFRREKPQEPTFAERLENLRKLGFSTEADGPRRVRISKSGCAAIVEDRPGDRPHIDRLGILIGKEIALLIFAGYQMFLRAPGGSLHPASASQLKALHAFEEDLREGLGLVTLFNEALGTTSDEHLYDRLEGRDEGAQPKPWQKTVARSS
ncbi:MAG TPA: hypothetical protein VKV15_13530 [Bryobacteraceae bacterium]|nr:hypothetical protein [Bryobacteraceae bacterium]